MIPLNNHFNQNLDKYLLTVSFPEISSERILHNLKQGSEMRLASTSRLLQLLLLRYNLEAAATMIDHVHGRKAKHKSASLAPPPDSPTKNTRA